MVCGSVFECGSEKDFQVVRGLSYQYFGKFSRYVVYTIVNIKLPIARNVYYALGKITNT